nr:putative transcription elongation factor SPT5 homolog 1 isoform X1 [Tanacetum cinerariifolium]
MTPMIDSGATPNHDGMRTPIRDRAWNSYTPMSPPRDSWEDENPGSWGSSPQYQPGSPRSRAYEAPTSAAHDAMFSIFTGTPGGQPMTPGGADLDIMSPGVGGDNDEPWFLPDILVNVHRSGDDAALGVIREVLLVLFGLHHGLRRWYNHPWYSEPIPSTPYDPLVLRHAFEKDLDQEKQITASTFMKILNLLLAIGTGSYPFLDPLEMPTSSHTKRKEEIVRAGRRRTLKLERKSSNKADGSPLVKIFAY